MNADLIRVHLRKSAAGFILICWVARHGFRGLPGLRIVRRREVALRDGLSVVVIDSRLYSFVVFRYRSGAFALCIVSVPTFDMRPHLDPCRFQITDERGLEVVERL